MSPETELGRKQRLVLEFLDREDLDGLLLSKNANFAWVTCGGSNHVAVNSDTGVAHVLVTRHGRWVICDNIESRRVMEEEVASLGFASESFYWYENKLAEAVERLAPGARIGSDTGRAGMENVEARLGPLRASLLPEEVDRYRSVGAATAACMTEACRKVRPGVTEHQIAGMLGEEMLARGVFPVVILIAADDRAFNYRHPIPTGKRVESHAMLVVCGRKGGLIVSMTRLVHFGALPAELRRKHDAVAAVDAAFIANTTPGARVGDVFSAAVEAYAAGGFPDEWRLHHQGGPTGYVGREFRATADTEQIVVDKQAFAWNPSIAGTKSEDTIIALSDGPEVISATPELPVIEVEAAGQVIRRSDILIL
ncbi:MAG: M24 family metallopeptidase [Armatimonadota bacterium]|nr:MAG: M24 family metallopeptidase [Armatimonadota bacterium]